MTDVSMRALTGLAIAIQVTMGLTIIAALATIVLNGFGLLAL